MCVSVWVGFGSSFADCFGMSPLVSGPKVAKQRSEERGAVRDGCWAMRPAREWLLLALLRSSLKDAHRKGLIRERFDSYTVILCWLPQARSVVQM